MLFRIFVAFAAIVFAGLAFAPSASAQATRTWVSGVGDDVNPCSRTAPCRTLVMAVAKTASGGEVSVLDPMALGVVTITKPMTIISSTERGGILASGTTGVIVNVAAGVDVYLEGLTIQGGGTGLAGIRMTGQGTLHIRNSIIRGFTGAAVSVEGGGGTRVFIDGLSASGNGFGVRIAGKSGAANSALVRNSAIVGNSTAAVQVENNGTLFVGSSSLVSSGGGSDIVTLGSGKVFSYGDNVVGNGNPTGLRPLK